jgi:hypothetical protein
MREEEQAGRPGADGRPRRQGHANEGAAAQRGRAQCQLLRDDYHPPALRLADADYLSVALVDNPGKVHSKLNESSHGAFVATG